MFPACPSIALLLVPELKQLLRLTQAVLNLVYSSRHGFQHILNHRL